MFKNFKKILRLLEVNVNHLQKLVGDGRIELHFNCSMQKVKVAKFILFSENVLILIIVQLQGVPKNALLDTTAVFEDDFLFLDIYYISVKSVSLSQPR